MKIKKLFALLLVLCMIVTVFAACANEEPAPSDGGSSDIDNSNNDDTGDDDDEITTIHFFNMDLGTTGSASKIDLVEAAINEITEREINVRVDFTWASFGDYATQLNLAIANNEPVDIAVYCSGGPTAFQTYYAKGYCLDIAPLLSEYGTGITDTIGSKYFKATTYDEGIYGIPTWRVLNSDYYLCVRSDILEETGVLEQAKQITSWSEYEAIMQAIKENVPSISPHTADINGMFGDCGGVFGSDKFADCYTYDAMGDTYYLVYSDAEGNVQLLWDNPDWINQCKMVTRWAQNGWLYSDSIFSNESAESLILQKAAAGYVCQSEIGVEVNKTQSFGVEPVCVRVGESLMSSYFCTKLGIIIPSTSEEPEAAIKFLNLCYTNADLMNLMTWGVEGETYVINDEGEATYPEGTDISTCGYHGYDWQFGNQFLTTPWEGQGADFRSISMENFQSAPDSPYLGIKVDIHQDETLLGGISVVQEEYHKQLSCGQYSEELLAEYKEKLEAAGINDYLKLFEDAVAEWTE